jgi:DNA topoisomerase-1
VKHGSVMASLPRKLSAEEVTLAQAIELLTAKAGAAPAPGGKAMAKPAPKKAAAKPRTAKSGKAPAKRKSA